MRTRVKFCGITCKEDALAAASLGVDAIGMVFHPLAKTAVTAEIAADIAAQLPPFVDVVALFVDAEVAEVYHVINLVQPQWLQFHGNETEGYCAQFDRPYINAYNAHQLCDMTATPAKGERRFILLDSAGGGTGISFDWSLLSTVDAQRVIVAGGLSTRNVSSLVRQYRPFGVDVSSSISCPSDRRKKDYGKMKSFMRAVWEANSD